MERSDVVILTLCSACKIVIIVIVVIIIIVIAIVIVIIVVIIINSLFGGSIALSRSKYPKKNLF